MIKATVLDQLVKADNMLMSTDKNLVVTSDLKVYFIGPKPSNWFTRYYVEKYRYITLNTNNKYEEKIKATIFKASLDRR